MPSTEKLPQLFAAAWNAHDMERFAGLFDDCARFVNVFGTYWQGREEIRAAHEATHATVFSRSTLSIDRTDRTDLSDGCSTQYVHWTLDGLYGPDGGAMAPRTGILLLVSRRDGKGDSLIVAAQNTDKVSGPN